MREYQRELHATALSWCIFCKRIGEKRVEKICQMSVSLHGELALEKSVNINNTVHEKSITYPTASQAGH
jgi:hypothetical protein